MTERRPGTPLLEDAIWIALLERYVQGETAAALAREHGVSVEAIAWQARNRGYRKMDRPDAVYRWRQPPPIAAHERRAGDLAFDYDPADPEGSAARALEQSARAAQEGRIEDHLRLNEAARPALRTGRVMRLGSPSLSEGGWPRRGRVGGAWAGHADRLALPTPSPREDPPPEGEGKEDALILRTAQRPPPCLPNGAAWSTWLFLGGRGAGKTLAGASWISDMAERCGRLALIGATLHDAREVMIGGPSGILSLPRWRAGGEWPVYQMSRRRLVFPNGAEAFVFSAEDPDSLRGPQFAAAWADEFCAWRDGGEVLAMVRMGLRLPLGPTVSSPSRSDGEVAPSSSRGDGGVLHGEHGAGFKSPSTPSGSPSPSPSSDGEETGGTAGAQAANDRVVSGSPPQLCVTTTPRPTQALRALRGEPSCVETHAGTADNAGHLAPAFLEGLQDLYGGTRRAAQELEGLVVEPEGGLFTAQMMVAARKSLAARA